MKCSFLYHWNKIFCNWNGLKEFLNTAILVLIRQFVWFGEPKSEDGCRLVKLLNVIGKFIRGPCHARVSRTICAYHLSIWVNNREVGYHFCFTIRILHKWCSNWCQVCWNISIPEVEIPSRKWDRRQLCLSEYSLRRDDFLNFSYYHNRFCNFFIHSNSSFRGLKV